MNPPKTKGIVTFYSQDNSRLMSEYMGVIFMEEKISSGRLHRLVLSDRHTGSVTGVNDVVSFDENEIVLDTDMGLLTVRGKELHVKRLTLEKGELDLEGQVDSLNYSSNAALKRSGDSFLNRLFK